MYLCGNFTRRKCERHTASHSETQYAVAQQKQIMIYGAECRNVFGAFHTKVRVWYCYY